MFDLSAVMVGVYGFIVFLFASDHNVEDGGEFLASCYHGLQMPSFCTHVTEVVAERAFGCSYGIGTLATRNSRFFEACDGIEP